VANSGTEQYATTRCQGQGFHLQIFASPRATVQ
jgi:hypothetical protein